MQGPIRRSDTLRVRFSQRLELLAHLLFVLFLLFCLVPLWPIRALDPGWLLSLGHQILQVAGLALIGITLLEFAKSIAPWRRHLGARRTLVLATARLVSVGFVLMIPLQLLLTWQTRTPVPAPPVILLAGDGARQAGALQPGLIQPLIALAYGLVFYWFGRRRQRR